MSTRSLGALADEPDFVTSENSTHERRLARGTLAQQGAQITSVLTLLVVVTAVARTLSLSEFGVYGLALSFSNYLLFAQGSVEAAAIKQLAEARNPLERDRAFTTALAVYLAYGFVAAILIGVGGTALIGVFEIPSQLVDQARLGVIAIGVATLFGWPMKTFQDVLRGSHRFAPAAAAEVAAYLTFTAAMLVLLLVIKPPLWVLIGLAGSLPMLTGIASAAILVVLRLPYRLRPGILERTYTRRFLGFSLYVLASGASDLVIYSLDRAVLAIFRSASTVGLYEAVVRPHNLIRSLHGSLNLVVLPASATFMAQGDDFRVRELMVRGSRYVLAIIMPTVVVLMTLAQPILSVWLGDRFTGAAFALTVFVGYWLIGGGSGVAWSMLTAAGRVRALAIFAWSLALVNLGLSLALTPSLGLDGVVLATTIAYFAFEPVALYLIFTTLPVKVGEFARRVWIPNYTLGAALAGALLALRFTVGLDTLPAVLAAGAGGTLGYWGAFYWLWMDAAERRFVRGLARRA